MHEHEHEQAMVYHGVACAQPNLRRRYTRGHLPDKLKVIWVNETSVAFAVVRGNRLHQGTCFLQDIAVLAQRSACMQHLFDPNAMVGATTLF